MSTTSAPETTVGDARRVTRFLVPLDGTEASTDALPVAAALAVRMGVAVEVIDCVPPLLHWLDEGVWVDQELQAAGLALGGAAPVRSSVDVVDAIVADAARVPGTVICMASHGRNAVGELVFGSVTHDVIVASPAPVVVVGPRCKVPSTFERIQVCVDGSHASEPVVDVAIDWGRRLQVVPWLTQVVEPAPPADGLGGPGPDVVEGSGLGRLARRGRAADVDVEWDVLHGRAPGPALLAWTTQHDPALVVAGSHGRTSVQRLRLGSVTGWLIHELPCPLLVVGPSVTP